MNNQEIIKLFPEPIFKYQFEKIIESFNKELSKYIYDLRDQENNRFRQDQIKVGGIQKTLN